MKKVFFIILATLAILVLNSCEKDTQNEKIINSNELSEVKNQRSASTDAGICNPSNGNIYTRKYDSDKVNTSHEILVDGWSKPNGMYKMYIYNNGAKSKVYDINTGVWEHYLELEGGENIIHISYRLSTNAFNSIDTDEISVLYVKKPEMWYPSQGSYSNKIKIEFQTYWNKNILNYHPYFRVWRSETNNINCSTRSAITGWISCTNKYGDYYGDNDNLYDTNITKGKKYYYFVEISPYSNGSKASEFSNILPGWTSN